MSGKLRILLSLLAATALVLFALAPTLTSQDPVEDLRTRFAHEPDSIRRAKLLSQLGNAEFQEISKDFTENRLSDALTILEQYRDEAQDCEKKLDAKGVNAEQHPAGFKQLQFSLRDSLRRLDDLLVTLTIDEQAPFEGARRDIDDMNRHLIHELFPRQPETVEPHPKPVE